MERVSRSILSFRGRSLTSGEFRQRIYNYKKFTGFGSQWTYLCEAQKNLFWINYFVTNCNKIHWHSV